MEQQFTDEEAARLRRLIDVFGRREDVLLEVAEMWPRLGEILYQSLIVNQVSLELLQRHYSREELGRMFNDRIKEAFPGGVKNLHDVVNEMEEDVRKYIQ
ncbi:MAG: hypothetical protein NTU61_05085 [Candidatus Altiarchaeota archaeon]|nr:hypothetical protein [Candidatus Altiarchaeota archaeon]